jgi:hypothetical protein
VNALSIIHGVAMLGLAIAPLLAARPAAAGGVVGSGTPSTCTEAALDAALADGGLVTFNCGPRPFTLTVTTTKAVLVDTRLDGSGRVTLSGGNRRPIFIVTVAAHLALSNLTLRNGRHSFGGAIYNEGTVTVDACTFARNYAPNAEADGGAINNNGGVLTVSNSTFARNHTDGVSGAIQNTGTLTVSNSTFARNYASVGGAIGSSGPVTITNCTFAGNRTVFAGTGDAIYSAGDTVLQNSIIASTGRGLNCVGPVTDGGHNLRWPPRDSSCVGALGNPRLGRLANNGSPVQTMKLRPGSAAINAGDSATCAADPVNNRDQRGFVRPGAGATNCSIGAYEFNASAPAP